MGFEVLCGSKSRSFDHDVEMDDIRMSFAGEPVFHLLLVVYENIWRLEVFVDW